MFLFASAIVAAIITAIECTTTATLTTTTTHSDGGQQSLGHVGDNNANKEDDCVKPVIAEDEGNDEERDAEEDSDGSDDVNEVSDLASYRRLTDFQPTRQVSNPTHHCTIPSVNHQATSRAYNITLTITTTVSFGFHFTSSISSLSFHFTCQFSTFPPGLATIPKENLFGIDASTFTCATLCTACSFEWRRVCPSICLSANEKKCVHLL